MVRQKEESWVIRELQSLELSEVQSFFGRLRVRNIHIIGVTDGEFQIKGVHGGCRAWFCIDVCLGGARSIVLRSHVFRRNSNGHLLDLRGAVGKQMVLLGPCEPRLLRGLENGVDVVRFSLGSGRRVRFRGEYW